MGWAAEGTISPGAEMDDGNLERGTAPRLQRLARAMEEQSASRQLRALPRGLEADRKGRALVADLRARVDSLYADLARVQALRALGRPQNDLPIAKLREDLEAARQQLTDELRDHGRDVHVSAPVRNLKRSLDRAIEITRSLAER